MIKKPIKHKKDTFTDKPFTISDVILMLQEQINYIFEYQLREGNLPKPSPNSGRELIERDYYD